MKRSNKTFADFILRSPQKPTTFVEHLHSIMNHKQQHRISATKASACCCCICCMP